MQKLALAIGVLSLMLSLEGSQGPPCSATLPAGASCALGGVAFVKIPAGTFAMGDRSDVALPNEQPVHDVTLDAFWMAKTELTFEQWKAFVVATGYRAGRAHAKSDDHPVVGVTWDDAKAYCDWLSTIYNRVVRLPTEAEWEYAARGGLSGRRYPNGDSISAREANYASDGAVRVASYPPNGHGLYDMAGNVFEWVGDWYDRDFYRVSPRRNPRGPLTRNDAPQRRADRGGGWCMGVENVRVSARHAGPGPWDEGGTAGCLGFRPVMEVQTRRMRVSAERFLLEQRLAVELDSRLESP